MAEESWRPVPGFPCYVVSDQGRMRSLTRLSRSGKLLAGAPMPMQVDNHGYLKANVTDARGAHRVLYLHRAVAMAWCPNDDPARKTEVDHLNCDHEDARACNLEWVTPEENKRRAHEKMGDAMRRRLTPEQVELIRASKGRPYEVAARLGVKASAVSDIRRGKTHRI